MSLHLIPHEKIHKMFKYLEKNMSRLFEKDNVLHGKKHDQEMVRQFFSYMRVNWIDGNVWPPEKWSVFNQHIRTNNDAEGWHDRINERARAKLNFYELVPKLFDEARLIPLQKKLLCKNKILKRCRKNTASVNANLLALWDSYPQTITCKKLLKSVSEIDVNCNQLNDAKCWDDEKDDLSE